MVSDAPIIGNKVVLCGSFNPLHDGHLNLLNSARAKISGTCNLDGSCFEMALTNADKGAMQADDPMLLARIKQFTDRELTLLLCN